MLVSNAKTLTIVLILYILPKCTFSASIEGKEAKRTPITMYEVLALKFSNISIDNLRNSLEDIFTSQCNNWTAIVLAKPMRPDMKLVSCHLLYESLDIFLTKIGKPLSDSFVDTIMTGNYTLEDICMNNKSFSSNSSTLSAKKDLSEYLTPSNCFSSCQDTSKSSTNQVIDICKAAYFFATFDVSKFIANSKFALKISESQTNQRNNGSSLKESKNQASAPEGDSKIQNNQLPTLTKAEVQKPKQTDTNQNSLGHPQGEQQSLASNTSKKNSQEEIMNKTSVNKDQTDGLSRDESKTENGHDKTEKSLDPAAGVSNTKTETKDLSKTETLQEKKSPITPAKHFHNAQVESDNNNDRENQEENSLDNDNGKEEAYSGVTGDESDNTKQDENAKPDLFQQPEPKKVPSKKAKPNTLDAEESASSNDTVDDDMDGDSYFFSYFTVLMCLVIVGYVGYHNRQKVLALLLEGKRGKRNGRNARRPNSANYHKLDSNLEEAMSSSCTKNASNIIY